VFGIGVVVGDFLAEEVVVEILTFWSPAKSISRPIRG
jgi:hypothetical protein